MLPSLLQEESFDRSAESTVSYLVSESLVTVCNKEPHLSQESVAPHILNQDLNDLIRELELFEDKLELLPSNLNHWYL